MGPSACIGDDSCPENTENIASSEFIHPGFYIELFLTLHLNLLSFTTQDSCVGQFACTKNKGEYK